MDTAAVLLVALILDAIIGEPRSVWGRIPHPIVLMGRVIEFADEHLNEGDWRRLSGILALMLAIVLLTVVGLLVSAVPDFGILEALIAAILLCQKSLIYHVTLVASGLRISLSQGQSAVSDIVGRDTRELDENGVSRAAIESISENFSDGVVAPAFWFLLAGLPGILIYKFVNTADSMIGYRDERYAEFGWATARLDDALNWIPARLAGCLIALAGRSWQAIKVMRRDAPSHRSPNAGWPEAAMAAALGVAVSGPRTYGGISDESPFVNAEGRKDLTPDDIDAAVSLIWKSWIVLCAIIALTAFIL